MEAYATLARIRRSTQADLRLLALLVALPNAGSIRLRLSLCDLSESHPGF
jgi:hypothetical protein